MAVKLVVPSLGESITEVVIGSWLKTEGQSVQQDESIAELESDKATVELPAPASGVIGRLLKGAGDSAAIGEVIGYIEEGQAEAAAEPVPATKSGTSGNGAQPAAAAASVVMPAAAAAAAQAGIDPTTVTGTGKGGRVLKEDVQAAAPTAPAKPAPPATKPAPQIVHTAGGGEEEIVAMTPIRKKIAERLVQSQNETAHLTTFNDIDMGAVMNLRKQYQEKFTEKYGIKVGFMSFFVKAAIEALKAFPQVNAEIRGTNIVYKNYYDIGMAVGGGKGLVVPVIRAADRQSFAELELSIADYADRAQKNKLDLSELEGGTFTISNGGVYGSLMSTPIINPPQVAVLGLHAIQDRPVVRDGQVVVRPMMYVALTYDHRIVDGRESVTFLRRIKDIIEDPARLLLEV